MSKTCSFETTQKLLARYRKACVQPEPWRREAGVRLMATVGGLSIREDCVGRLYQPADDDFIVGRDEHRLRRYLFDQRDKSQQRLRDAMLVDRELVIGRKAVVSTFAVRKRDCRVCVAGDSLAYPPPFVTYRSKPGMLMHRRLVFP